MAETLLAHPSDTPYESVVLVNKLINALESDAAWVDMYGITGELVVPETPPDGEDDADLLEDVKKVG